MKRTLFEIGSELQRLAELFDDSGEASPDTVAFIDQYFAELQTEQARKLDGYAGLIAQLEMEAAASRLQAEFWNAKAAAKTNSVKRLKDRLRDYLTTTGQLRVQTADGRIISVQPNGGAMPIVLDESVNLDQVPERFVEVKRTLDSVKVREALVEGEVLTFARLGERGSHIRIR